MRTAIVSYSLTGKNDALASRVANALSLDQVKISEPKKRSTETISLDLIFNRTPNVSPDPQTLKEYDNLVFIAPVWMGQPAFTLRAYLKFLKTHPQKYGFVTLCGGSWEPNPNPKLRSYLTKLAGSDPTFLVEMYIAHFMPKSEKLDLKAIEAFQLSESDLAALTTKAVDEINEHFR